MQAFDTVDVLRLEVEDDPTGLTNLVQNPSGDLGGWGWVTPVAGSAMTGSPGDGLVYFGSAAAGNAEFFYTEALPVAAGEYVAATLQAVGGSPDHFRVRFEWLDAAMNVLSSSPQSAYTLVTAGTLPYGPHQAPASTAHVRLRVDLYDDTSGTNPPAGNSFRFTQVTVAKAATAGALGSLRTNLIPNPSFETNTTGWAGVGATVARSTAQAMAGTASLAITSTSASPFTASGARTANLIPVTSGADYAVRARVRATVAGQRGYIYLRWYDASRKQVGSTTVTSVNLTVDTWTLLSGVKAAPSNAAFVDVLVQTLVVAAAGEVLYVDTVMLERSSTVGEYFDGSSPDVGGFTYDTALRTPTVIATRTNLVPNPSFEVNTTGWSAGGNTTIARVTSPAGASGAACLRLTRTGSMGSAVARTPTGTSGIPVTPGKQYALSLYVRPGATARTMRMSIRWYTSTGAFISDTLRSVTEVAGQWVRGSDYDTAPANAAFAAIEVQTWDTTAVNEQHYIDAVLFEEGGSSPLDYFDGSTPDGTADFATVDRAWTGTAHASKSTETITETLPYSTATSSNLAFIEPVPYLDVLGPTHTIKTVRESLNLGTLEATILDASLDPLKSDLIRPGRRVRLLALTPSGDWLSLFTGKATRAVVTYDPKRTDEARARIELTAVDATATLANVKRAEGVATIEELPYVLEGAGVPWNIDGSGAQAPSAVVVARNENASALDQVALTRDTALGYAWVDRNGVMQVRSALHAYDDSGYGYFSDTFGASFTGIDMGYATDEIINEVTVKYLRLNPATGETEEVVYGPFRDEESIAEWGAYGAEFTIQGIAEEVSNIEAYAAQVLTWNALPGVKVRSLTFPVIATAEISPDRLLDLNDIAGVELLSDDPDYYHEFAVKRVEHTITPEKWVTSLGFATTNAVASPTVSPAPGNPEGKTIGQLLRPVGEVTGWYGAKADCPAGWLVMDGSAIPAQYADLIALVGPTLPDMTDRFPVGAGNKALGTSGGAPTKTIGVANLPSHSHGAGTLTAGSSGSAHEHGVPRGTGTGSSANRSVAANTTAAADGATTSSGAHSHNVTGSTGDTGSGTPLDVMPPWRAFWWIIRAV